MDESAESVESVEDMAGKHETYVVPIEQGPSNNQTTPMIGFGRCPRCRAEN